MHGRQPLCHLLWLLALALGCTQSTPNGATQDPSAPPHDAEARDAAQAADAAYADASPRGDSDALADAGFTDAFGATVDGAASDAPGRDHDSAPSDSFQDAGGDAIAPPAFRFEMARGDHFPLWVRSLGQPVPHAVITLREASDDDFTSKGALYSGATDGDGGLEAHVTLPVALEQVEVIVRADGYTGPYENPILRSQHGPTAPTSWERISVAALAGHVVNVERQTP